MMASYMQISLTVAVFLKQFNQIHDKVKYDVIKHGVHVISNKKHAVVNNWTSTWSKSREKVAVAMFNYRRKKKRTVVLSLKQTPTLALILSALTLRNPHLQSSIWIFNLFFILFHESCILSRFNRPTLKAKEYLTIIVVVKELNELCEKISKSPYKSTESWSHFSKSENLKFKARQTNSKPLGGCNFIILILAVLRHWIVCFNNLTPHYFIRPFNKSKLKQ